MKTSLPQEVGEKIKFKNHIGPPKPPRCYNSHFSKKPKWDLMKEKVVEIYKENGLPQRLVVEIMWCLYDFKMPDSKYHPQVRGKWGIVKNRQRNSSCRQDTQIDVPGTLYSQQQRRTREQKHLKPPQTKVLPDVKMIALEEFTPKRRAIYWNNTLSSAPEFKLQEKIIIGLDRYIRSTFNRSSKRWVANMVSFISPEPTVVTTRREWERVADQCTTIEDLIEKEHIDMARAVMDDALTLLPTGPRISDPSLLLQIWQICLKLLSIDERGNFGSNNLDRFFRAIRDRLVVMKMENKHSDLLSWVEALQQVGRGEMKETIRIAIFKTAATLKEHIGDENIMVLQLWSLYCRKWAGSQRSRTALMAKLEYVFLHTKHLPVAETIAIRYYYTYALHRMSSPGEEVLVAKMAGDLIADIESLSLPPEPKWDMRLLAFQVCAKLWAEYLHSHTQFLESRNQSGASRNQTRESHDQASEPLHFHNPADKPLRFRDLAGKSFRFRDQANNDPKTDIHLRRLCSCWIMTSAITILERGDIVCQVAAASMAMTLARWLRQIDDRSNTHKVDWNEYARELLAKLPKEISPLPLRSPSQLQRQ